MDESEYSRHYHRLRAESNLILDSALEEVRQAYVMGRTRTDAGSEHVERFLNEMHHWYYLGAEAIKSGERVAAIGLVARTKREALAAEFVGMCENPAVHDSDLEWLVGELVRVHMKHALRRLLVGYVEYRQPGEWFWDWWRSEMAYNKHWKIETEWAMVEMYMCNTKVGAVDAVNIVEEYGLYHIVEAYLQHWASVELCRKWLKRRVSNTGNSRGVEGYDLPMLTQIYAKNVDKTIDIINGEVLAAIITTGPWGMGAEELIEAAFTGIREADVLDALARTPAESWSRQFEKVLAKVFSKLRPRVKAKVLEVARRNIVLDLIKRLGVQVNHKVEQH